MNGGNSILAVAGPPLLPLLAWAAFFGLGYAYVTVLCVFGAETRSAWGLVAAGPLLFAVIALAFNGWIAWRARSTRQASQTYRRLTIGSALLSSVAIVWIAGAMVVIRSC